MAATIDTRKAHQVRHHGDLAAILTWVNDERALVLLPHRRPGAPWFVVMESASFAWDDSLASNIPGVVQRTTRACHVLGIEPTPTNCRRIAGIVIDALPELIRMPSAPAPEYHRGNFGSLAVMADGKRIASENIRIEKDQGASYG